MATKLMIVCLMKERLPELGWVANCSRIDLYQERFESYPRYAIATLTIRQHDAPSAASCHFIFLSKRHVTMITQSGGRPVVFERAFTVEEMLDFHGKAREMMSPGNDGGA